MKDVFEKILCQNNTETFELKPFCWIKAVMLDKTLPKKNRKPENLLSNKLEHYCFTHTSAEPDYLLELIKLSNEHMEFSKKISGRIVGRLLKLLVQLSKPTTLLEIGTFTGYSALSMAEALESQARIFCLESSPKAVEFTNSFLKKTPYHQQITLIQGHALETITRIKGPLDFVFIDADKRNYQNYYNLVFNKVKLGGLIVIDNVLWDGNVLNPKKDSDLGVAKLNEQIKLDNRIENILLGIRDGLHIIRKIADGPQPILYKKRAIN